MSLKYRSEIEGLRALAVLAVVINHANESWLPRGFLGVDIFFTISGYLITQLIVNQMQSGSFSFLEFYKKRAKRLLPAFFLVLTITTILAFFIFLPNDFDDYLRSLIASIFFSANLFFSMGTGYFEIASLEKPLLHIWSLSVEEQFYFAFPLILFIVFKYFPHKLFLCVATLFAISLLSFKLRFGLDAYYLPHIRAYELLIGSLLAIVPKRQISSQIQAVLLLLVVLTLMIPTEFLTFGKGYIERLIVCGTTAFLLGSVVQENSRVGIVLNNNVLRFFGLISYSLYLWHWVVFAFMRYVTMNPHLSFPMIVVGVGTSILLAYITYTVIENPIRRRQLSTRAFIGGMTFYFTMGILVIAFFIFNKQNHATNTVNLGWEEHICHDRLPTSHEDCLKGQPNAIQKVFVIGDSHAGQYNRFIDIIAQREGWQAQVLSANSCPYLYGVERPKHRLCNQFREYVNQHIHEYDTVILIGRRESYLGTNNAYEQNFASDLQKTIEFLVAQNKQVHIFEDNPTVSVNVLRNYQLGKYPLLRLSKKEPSISEASIAANAQIRALVTHYPGVYTHNINSLIPSDFMVDNLPIYKDDNHFNPYGMEKMAEIFINGGFRLIPATSSQQSVE